MRGLFSPERTQQFARTKLVDHRFGFPFIDGCDTKDHVVQRFGEDAAEAEHDHRSELGVTEQTRDELPSAGEHRLDQITFQILPGCRSRFQRRLAHLAFIPEIQADQAPFRLVRELRSETLQDNGKAEPVRSRDGLFRRHRDLFPNDRHAESAEDLLRFRLSQRGSSFRFCCSDPVLCLHDVSFVLVLIRGARCSRTTILLSPFSMDEQ